MSARAMERPEAEEAYAEMLESICGATDDSQPVEQYDGTLGVTVAFVNANQRSAGQVQWDNNLAAIYTSPGNVSDARWGSGTLLANNLFLTAGHLFDQTGGGWTRPRQNGTMNTITPQEIATRMHVNFNYQVDPAGVLRAEQRFPITALLEYRLGGLDFAIVQLGGNPVPAFGTAVVSTTDGVVAETICIMGHPAGVPKRIEAGTVFSVGANQIRYDNIDTLGGNSGSGILRAADGRVVGVHTNGGCNAAGTGQNSGVSIAAIIAASPTLQALLRPKRVIDDISTVASADVGPVKVTGDFRTSVFADVIGTFKFRDDRVTLKFTDDGGGTLKHIDDRKLPALDKQFSDVKLPGSDGFPFDPRQPVTQPGGFSGPISRPFILANPHHSAPWAAREAAEAQVSQSQYEAALEQLQQMMQEGQGELEALQSQYQQLLSEYQMVRGGQ